MKTKLYLCQVQMCPGESDITDDKQYFKECLQKTFGEDFELIKCEHINSKSTGKALFCEMLIKADHADKAECPNHFIILQESEQKESE